MQYSLYFTLHSLRITSDNCGNCQICIVDKGEPIEGSREEYTSIAAEQRGKIPTCQYPGAGNAYSHGSNERALYDVAVKVAQETLHHNFPEATAETILVLHGNLDDGWAHSNEPGSMHAWKRPEEEYPEADTYAWCRGGATAAKRFHIFVCADCASPPCLPSNSPPTVDSPKEATPAEGLGYLLAGVATLQNIALYTDNEIATRVASCGAVEALSNLLVYYKTEIIEMPSREPPTPIVSLP